MFEKLQDQIKNAKTDNDLFIARKAYKQSKDKLSDSEKSKINQLIQFKSKALVDVKPLGRLM